MIINLTDFHAQYGAGRPAIKGAHSDIYVKSEKEIPILTALVDHFKCRRVLEIGVNTGATSAAILAGNTVIEECIGVDLNKIWYVDEPAGHFALPDPRFRLIQSAGGLYDMKPADLAPLDFVFIDADHSYKAIKYDTEFSRQALNPAGGVIAWHDYQHPNCPDVRKYIHEINDQPGQPPIVWVRDTTICYQIFEAKTVKGKSKNGNSKSKTSRIAAKR
jgi:spermidine synthase